MNLLQQIVQLIIPFRQELPQSSSVQKPHPDFSVLSEFRSVFYLTFLLKVLLFSPHQADTLLWWRGFGCPYGPIESFQGLNKAKSKSKANMSEVREQTVFSEPLL